MYVRESTPSIAFGRGTEASPTFFTLVARDSGSRCTKFRRAKKHVMWSTELQRGEIEIERRLQLFAVPGVTAKELLVVGAFLVPVRQERACEIDPFSVPALRHHVDLPPNIFLINLFRFLRIRNVEYTAFAVAEAIDKERFVIGAQADIDGENSAFDVTDRRNLFCLPFAAIVRVNEPKLRSQRGGGESIVVLIAPSPADFERRAWHLKNFLRLAGMEIPHHHGAAEMFHGFGIGSQFAEVPHIVVQAGE